MTQIYTGLALAAALQQRNRQRIAALGRAPVCITLFDPEQPAAHAYLARLTTLATDIGLILRPEAWPAHNPAARLAALAADPAVDAILPLWPLPPDLPPARVLQHLGPAKEVDGQHPLHAGALVLGQPQARAPATAMAARLCAQDILGGLAGSHIVLIGASSLIGRPLAQLLLAADATVTLCHAASRDLSALCHGADLVVSATGVPGLIDAEVLPRGGRLLDLGITRVAGQLQGDGDWTQLIGHAALVSHVPDGVGPVTTACMMANIIAAAAGMPPDYQV